MASDRKERVVLVDGTALVFRAFFAIPGNLRTSNGVPTNASFGFAKMFRKVFAGKTPTRGAVVFDAPGRSFRADIAPTYKANRERMPDELARQLPWIDKLVEAHNFPLLRIPDVEADDVIGTLTREALAGGREVYIVSGDKDFAQLVGPHVRVMDPTREVVYDEALVFRKYGVRPDQFVDYLAMVGDSSDNIPGVPGIGAKGAAKLLASFDSLDALLARTDELKGRQRTALTEHRDQALLSRRLATIEQQVPLPTTVDDLVVTEPTAAQLDAIYRELEFWSLLSAQDTSRQRKEPVQYYICDNEAAVRAALNDLPDTPVALEVLYELPSHQVGAIAGIALSPTPRMAIYFPIRCPEPARTVSLELLRAWLEDASRPKIAHEVKNAWVALKRHGIDARGFVGDTGLASFLVDPTGLLPHRLEQVARQYLRRAVQPLRPLIGGGKSLKRFAELPVGRAGAYACHLADAVGEVWPKVHERLRALRLVEHHDDIDLPLSFVLGQMELDGIGADAAHLAAMGNALKAERAAVEAEIHALAGHPFNVGSLKQLGRVLFEELGLPILKRTKTGYSTTKDVLERLSDKHAIIPLLLRWRTLDGLITVYADVLLGSIREDGRIHAIYMPTVSASGRLITTEPNLQRTPVRTEEFRRVREGFVAPPGHKLVSADWSQIELRILAHFTEDASLVSAYSEGRDVHRATAAELFSVSEGEVTARQREIGKTVNFATIYGQGATALGKQLGIPRREAKGYIERFFETHDGVATWKDKQVAAAYTRGVVTTLLGRRRQVTELSSNNQTQRSYGERIATNTPIQGSAADLCKLAMRNIARALQAEGLTAKMVLQIHDELVFEVPDDQVDALVALVGREMREVYPLNVPLEVGVGIGQTWSEAH